MRPHKEGGWGVKLFSTSPSKFYFGVKNRPFGLEKDPFMMVLLKKLGITAW